MINFPENPALDTIHSEGGKSWKFNGSAWVGLGSTISTIAWSNVTGKPSVFDPSTHTHQPSEVGLGMVNNTSDLDKPVSTATQTALDGKAGVTHTHPLSQLDQSGATAGQVPAWDAVANQWKPAAAASSWNNLADKPSLFSGSYADLTNVPSSFPASAHTHPLSQLQQSNATAGQVATWDATAQAWVPQTPASGTLTLTGDVTGSGSGSVAATLANSGVTSGTYRSVTVDAKGRVTNGSNPTTLSGYGITDALASNTTGLSGATALTNIVQITQSGYNALGANASASTLYIIVG